MLFRKIPKSYLKLKLFLNNWHVLSLLILGGITAWLSKDALTLIILSGKSFSELSLIHKFVIFSFYLLVFIFILLVFIFIIQLLFKINILGFIRDCTNSFSYDRSKNFIKSGFSESNRMFLKLFFLIPLGMIVTFITYYLLSQMFYYFPEGAGGKEVFLLPRYTGQQNDLLSGIFNQWGQLFFIIIIGVILIYVALHLSRNKKITIARYLVIIYIFALILEFLFVLLTPNGFGHLELQAKSINNGIWTSLSYIFDVVKVRNLNFVDTMRYIYTDLGSNNSGYTIPGTTHPPGNFLVSIVIFKLATNIFYFVHNPPLAWAITVTLINTLLIIVIALIARELFSVRISKLTAAFLLTTPSVLMHFCAMGDVISSVFIASGILIMIKVLKNLRLAVFHVNVKKMFFMGILSGLFFMLSLQMSYGTVVPISALTLTFLVFVNKKDIKGLSIFIFGIFVPILMYFIFEYWISSGNSFWITRALIITKLVEGGLSSRPYPLTQVANFVVMFVMGGVLCLSCVIFMSGYTIVFLIKLILRRFYIQNTRELCRIYLSFSFVLVLLFLIFQTTVRLEVERTLHWFFIFIWSMSGIFLVAIDIIYRRVFPNMFIRNRKLGMLIILLLQFFITLVLAMGIQDYY